MFVRMLLASATLASGLILGNWFLSFPSHAPFAPAEVAGLRVPDRGTAPPAGIRSISATTATPPQPAPAQPVATAPSASAIQAWPDATVSRARLLQQPDANFQSAITRELQAELLRLGCYGGPLDGRWSPALRYALQDFTVRVNVMLPIDGPDPALLNLARGQQSAVCGSAASASVTVTEQAGISPAPNGGLATDGSFPAGSLDGRMSLGATAEPGAASKAAPRRSVTKDEKLFLHPLGQL
jgi:hypothetical protein